MCRVRCHHPLSDNSQCIPVRFRFFVSQTRYDEQAWHSQLLNIQPGIPLHKPQPQTFLSVQADCQSEVLRMNTVCSGVTWSGENPRAGCYVMKQYLFGVSWLQHTWTTSFALSIVVQQAYIYNVPSFSLICNDNDQKSERFWCRCGLSSGKTKFLEGFASFYHSVERVMPSTNGSLRSSVQSTSEEKH